MRIYSLLAALLALLLLACRGDQDPSRVRIALNWFPEVEHGGVYAALVHGYYREEGVDVEIVPGGPDTPVLPMIAAGRVEFGVSEAADLLLARAQGVPAVALVAGLQHSPRCVMVRAESGVTSLADLADMTLAINIREPFAAFLRHRFRWSGVQIVPFGGTIAPFLVDPRLAQQAYVFSEPLQAESAGARVRCLLVSELGFDPYASVLVTSEELLGERRELAEKVARATARGWEQYLLDPSATNAELRARNGELAAEIFEREAAALAPLVRRDGEAVGAMSEQRWRALLEQMVAIGLIPADAVDPASAFAPGVAEQPASWVARGPAPRRGRP